MFIQALGPLRVLGPDGPIAVAGARERAALSWLAVHVGRPVPLASVARALWDRPPGNAEQRVRLALTTLAAGLPPGVITVGSAARLIGDSEIVDAARFRRLIDGAYRRWDHGESKSAATGVDDALELWRGSPFPDIAHTAPGRAEIADLVRLHAAALELREEAILADSTGFMVVADLRYLVGRYPDSLVFRLQLARALYREGIQVEALAVLRAAASDVGDDPVIDELTTAMLRQDSRAVDRASVLRPSGGASPR